MWGRIDGLRVMGLGTPGELRTWLNQLVLSGTKTATAGLLQLDYHSEGEPTEQVGEHLALVDDDGTQVATLEVTAVDLCSFRKVPWDFAQAEGEGFTSIDHWREVHQRYWEDLGERVDDDSTVVCVRFRLVSS